MTDTTITFTKEQIDTLCFVCSFYRSAMDKHSFAKGDVDKVKELQTLLIKKRREFEDD
jgi:hypothetical protein